jgi:hypothetical protein
MGWAYSLELGILSSTMPEMQDLHNAEIFPNPVEDKNGGMDKLADAKPTGDWAANIGESSQNIEMVEEGVPKALGGSWKIGPGIFDDALELG